MVRHYARVMIEKRNFKHFARNIGHKPCRPFSNAFDAVANSSFNWGGHWPSVFRVVLL